MRDIKHKAHTLCQKFNSIDEYDENQSQIIREFISENFFANFNLTIMDDAKNFIGDNVMFGPNVSLMATNHPLIAEDLVCEFFSKINIYDEYIFLWA